MCLGAEQPARPLRAMITFVTPSHTTVTFRTKRFAQSSSNGSCASTSDKHRAVVTTEGGYAMFLDRIKSPRCPKCGACMACRNLEPDRPGFASRTFECPKCYVNNTFVSSISHEIRGS